MKKNLIKSMAIVLGLSTALTISQGSVNVKANEKATTTQTKVIQKHAANGYWQGNYYYEDGKMVTGWHKIDGNEYYFESYGELRTDQFVKEAGKTYYVNKNGIKTKGWVDRSLGKYYFGDDYAMQTGWQKIDGHYYYLDDYRKTGWQTIGGKDYCFNTDGIMQTGFIKGSSGIYYCGSDGAQLKGWQKIDNKWYYFNEAATKGTHIIGDQWYCFDDNGVMQTGFVKKGKEIYYYGTDGAARSGWIQEGNNWYYANSLGELYTSCRISSGNTHYSFDQNGKMRTSTWTQTISDGVWHYQRADGSDQIGWFKDGAYWYYFDSDGDMVSNGSRYIGNQRNHFDANGHWLGVW